MKFFLTLILLALAVTGASAQSSPSPTVRWAPDGPGMDKFYVDGKMVKTITFDGITVWVSIGDQRLGTERVHYDKMVAHLGIVNRSDKRLEIAPENIRVEILQPRPRLLQREEAKKIAGKIKNWSAFSAAMGQIAASQQTVQSQSSGQQSGTVYGPGASGTYSGTSSTTTTSPDYAARRRADAQAEDLMRSAGAAGADLVRLELKQNTIMPGQEYGGMVIFEREKKAEEAIVRISFDGKILELPFTWPNK